MITKGAVIELAQTKMVCVTCAKDRFFPKPVKNYCMDYAITVFQAECRKLLEDLLKKGYRNYWCCGFDAMTLVFAMEACRLRECSCFLYFYTYEDLSYFLSPDFLQHDVFIQRRINEVKEFLLSNAERVSYMTHDLRTSPATVRSCQIYLSEHCEGAVGCYPPAKSKPLKLFSSNGPWIVNIYDSVKNRFLS